jgi:hypothetical protein
VVGGGVGDGVGFTHIGCILYPIVLPPLSCVLK